MKQIKLVLVPASDEPRVNDPAFQAELQDVTALLQATGAEFTPVHVSLHAVGAMDYQLAEFAIQTLGPHVIDGAAAVLTAWVAARASRKLRLKVGAVEAEAHTPEDIAALLKRADAFQQSTEKSGEGA